MRHFNKSKTVPKSIDGIASPVSIAAINDSIYKAVDVKKQLLVDQHNKCAYCESWIEGKFADVEHYRPKKSYRPNFKSNRVHNGYYWLAYDWNNLLVTCCICNRTCKNDVFALEKESQRDILNHSIAKEKPLMINPAFDDPKCFIEYHRYFAVPKIIDGRECERGRYTIKLLQLNNRRELVVARKERWQQNEKVLKQIKIANGLMKKYLFGSPEYMDAAELLSLSNEMLKDFSSENAVYSGMFI